MINDFRVGPWLVKPSLNIISRNGTTVRLEPKVMGVLVCLAGHAGDALPKETLLQRVWPETFVSEDVLKRSISELRRAFEDDAREPRIIETIQKRGYRLIAPVEPINGTKESPVPYSSMPTSRESGGSPILLSRHRWWVVGAVAIVGAIALSVFLIALHASRSARASGVPSIRSLAVLPLQNLSADSAQEYFSDGMTDALITELSHIGSVRVISRTSSMQYKQTKKSLPEIARELNVDGIIEGTVQRSGDRVRITAQLILGPADKHLWANSYERDLRDVFLLQRDVAGDIAGQVRARLTNDNHLQRPHQRAMNPAALEAYLQGKSHMHKFSRGFGDEELARASEYFRQAIDAESDFAAAYVGMAEARRGTLRSSDEDVDIAKNAAERAVELDPSLSDAWTVSAGIKCDFWDWAGAEQDYRRALALNPNDAVAHDGLGSLLDAQGRMDDGLKEAEIAQQLDPNDDHLEPALENRGEHDEVIQHITTMLEADPDNGILHHKLYEGYAGKRMYKEAIQQLEQAAALFGFPETASKLRQAFAASGYRAAMRKWAEELEGLQATNQVLVPINVAVAYVAAGNKERSFYWLEQAYKRRGHNGGIPMVFLNRDPGLEPLRSDPRYTDLLRRVGLPP